MGDKPLTARSTRIFWAIVTYKSMHDGCSPALSDLVEVCGGSKSTVKYHLTRLEKAGWIRKPAGMHARGIQVMGGQWKWTPPKAWKGTMWK